MASEITLKYLHPSIKTYITTENYNYDTSVNNEVLFTADVFEHGKDNVIQTVTTVEEYLFKYGEPNFAKFGQAGYNIERWLTNGGTAMIMRLLPENAAYSHAVFNVQYKNSTNGKTVLNNNGDETKINDVYLRPLVTYIGVNKTSESLIENELKEDRREYPTTDGYIDNFIFVVYPEGRGEYYNDLGFRIRLNPSYDNILTSRVYTFEILKYTDSGTYDIIDGPYYVSFDPDAIDPNSQKSMYIENVVNSYSKYVKVKVDDENFIKLATIINDEVDPYIIDIITGKSRIMDNGESETFYSSKTGKEEDVHISLHSYSSQGTVLSSNGEIILNISNNDEATSDIVDIADNSRRVIYNNQYYATQYMRTFFNWLINEKITQNFDKILQGNIESSIDNITGLLKDKATELIYNHIKNEPKDYKFTYKGIEKSDPRGNWYTKALEVKNPDIDIKKLATSDEAEKTFSTAEMIKTITEDGFITDTGEHLISYYHNFLKYFQYICNYDVIHAKGFVSSNDFKLVDGYLEEVIRSDNSYPNGFSYIYTSSNTATIPTNEELLTTSSNTPASPVLIRKLVTNNSDNLNVAIRLFNGKDITDNEQENTKNKNKDYFEYIKEDENGKPIIPKGYVFSSKHSRIFYGNDGAQFLPIDLSSSKYYPFIQFYDSDKISPNEYESNGYQRDQSPINEYAYLNAFYYDEDAGYLRPVYTFDELFDFDGKSNINGNYIKVKDFNGDDKLININSLSISTPGGYFYIPSDSKIFNSETISKNDIVFNSKSLLDYYDDYITKHPSDIPSIKPDQVDVKRFKEMISGLNITRNFDDIYLLNKDGYYWNVPNESGFAVVNHIEKKVALISLENLGIYITMKDIREIIKGTELIGDRNFANYSLVALSLSESKDIASITPLSNITFDGKPTDWSKFDYDAFYIKYMKDNSKIYSIESLIALISNTLKLTYSYNDDKEIDSSEINFVPITNYYCQYVSLSKNKLADNISTSSKPVTEVDKQNLLSYVQYESRETGNNVFKRISIDKISPEKYIGIHESYRFNKIFEEFTKFNKITQAINKVSSYAGLISKQLDGKGKSEINDIQNLRTLDYNDYSLTTIFNFLVGGFEAIVNNQGSITDYSNYASLKYLIKSINNKLDLRSTYLTMLNVHKNTVLDLSTNLAKNNISVILGDETLEFLYSELDSCVKEINYLINLISTILNKMYTIQNLDSFNRYDKNTITYANYFKKINLDEGYTIPSDTEKVDPLGIGQDYNSIGRTKKDDISSNNYKGILPLLESYLIELIGENHFGDVRFPSNNKKSLLDIYNNIKGGYTINGLDQSTYEDFYERLNTTLEGLTSIHSIINAFVNAKYISEIMDILVGSLNLESCSIIYNGKSFNVNSLMEYYNSGIDEELTQEKVMNLISNSVKPNVNERSYPITIDSVHPIFQYPYFSMMDIKDSIAIASENLDIVKSNINKQDHVLATLNTLCYDNLVQDMSSVIGLAEGSDGDFTYDNSSSSKLKEREHKINDVRIKAYKGTWNEDVLNKDIYEFDHIFDANYEDSVKNAIVTLARDERADFFFWADTKKQNTIKDALDWKNGFTNSTYFMAIYGQAQTWYDEYTSKNIELTTTYLLADTVPRHIANYGSHYPMAGSRRGVVGGFISNNWYPNENQKEDLYKNKINYLERDVNVIRYGSQNTNYPNGPLGSINNMLVMLKIKRKVEKIAKTYQFEFNTEETRSGMNAEINNYLKDWVNNGACTSATANVYSSNYDMIQKIARVDITLQFTGVIERVVINIDCPASI